MRDRASRALAVGSATPGLIEEREGLALARLAEAAAASRLGPIVEVGAYRGRSTCFLAAGSLAAGPPDDVVPVFSIDHHRGSEEMQAGWPAHDPGVVDDTTRRMDSLPSWRRAIEAAGVEDVVVGVVGDSPTVARYWGHPLSLVVLDGGHGAAIAWADYRGWSAHVAPGGVLAIHDVFPDPTDGGRPPYECYLDALESGRFVEDAAAASGSLRALRRRGDDEGGDPPPPRDRR